ncbi:hypothetical protein CON11_19685 [Priestia megaterium]|uniref:hypothetical protein n=1 Tax=Priestia megaterium TaxID=1404 RepID=UPI000BEB8B05|nr:hypothetical protein [Priestia megaterium]PEC43113.1 hypothetical protein CON11_19685 [Priestia megaterium]
MSIYNYEDLNKSVFKQRSIKNNKTHVKKAQKICMSYNTFYPKEFSQNSFLSSETGQPIAMLLKKLPNSYPINEIYVNGIVIKTSKFIKFDEKIRLAYFSNNNVLTIVDLDSIDGVSF